MVIFGASGDLTRRKLIPALYNLAKNKLLSHDFAVIGVARSPMSSEDYRKRVSEDIQKFATDKVDPEIWERVRLVVSITSAAIWATRSSTLS